VAGITAAALAVGGVAVAAAATSDSATPSAGPSAPAPSPGSSAAPGHGPRERTPFLVGTVVSASGNAITITDFQGFQRTIHTSSSTTYEDGLTATPAADTRIYAKGTVDSDKTSLKATEVGKLPDRPAAGPGHRGPGFPGGRHHDDGPGTAPGPGSGSATPAPPGPPGSGTPTPTPSPSGTA
jgi:hypothetical protein